MKKKTKIIIISTVLVFTAIMICIVYYLLNNDSIQYNKAKKLIESEKYEEALVIYNKIPEYKDVSDLIVNTHNEYAFWLLDRGIYEKAREQFKYANDSQTDANIQKCYQAEIEDYILGKSYDNALKILDQAGSKRY